MPNRLVSQTSPYLLQHKDNPVDWHPWDSEALARARDEDRPILLSIGYSACHWCHVMERESFEDEATATYMNEHFVCIKVDREERPDVDAIYMEAVQSMTGHGGWPLTAFLDADAVPFYGGTYFPPEPRQGMPSFRMVMEAVAESWSSQRERLSEATGRIRRQLGAAARIAPSDEPLSPELLAGADEQLRALADTTNGGIGGAPKFPPSCALEYLLARGEREVVRRTLDAMMCGGIHDQIGGGFARYAVDSIWLVPHFEKMLYDNALLARAYLHGWQAHGDERWRAVTVSTLDWMLAEMRGPEGGFYAALDADSEGEEGRFYVWEEAELRDALTSAGLGDDADALLRYWGVTPAGNFESRNILHLPGGPGGEPPASLDAARTAIYEVRSRRVWPGLDDKRICSWNALAIAALADAGAVLGRADYLDAARTCADFVLERMRGDDGRLKRTWKDERAPIDGYLEDYAFLSDALLVLYEATFEERWYVSARELANEMVERFADPELGGFFTTAGDAEALIARRKDLDDHPIPSGNSMAAHALLRLGALSGEGQWEEHAVGVFRLFARVAKNHPHAVGHLLRALDFYLSPTRELALVAPSELAELTELASVARGRLQPHLVVAGGVEGSTEPSLLAERKAVTGRPAAYVCERFACQAPVTEPAELAAALG
ncbi:MAG: thioredoxin domain-containing protein [Actinomycetota bacterium]|nr:thioredoxin domain-containing protein [Actinomycetota bacterium]